MSPGHKQRGTGCHRLSLSCVLALDAKSAFRYPKGDHAKGGSVP